MLTVEVVEVILVWIWDIVEIVYLFDGGRLYLGWLWRGGSLFLYLVNNKADIAGRRRHVERVGVLWRRGWMEREPGQQFTPRWGKRCAEEPLETKRPWKLMQARLDDAKLGNRESLGVVG